MFYVLEDSTKEIKKTKYTQKTKDTKKIIGTIWLTFDGRRFYLHHLVVHPDHRNKGYAKFLIEKALKCAKEAGIQIKLEVHAKNKAAIKLYQNYGFSKLDGYCT